MRERLSTIFDHLGYHQCANKDKGCGRWIKEISQTYCQACEKKRAEARERKEQKDE